MSAWTRGAKQESPDDDIQLIVLAWIMTRYDDPYRGVRRDGDFPNLWFGPVPGTIVRGTVVACSYWIEESGRVVVCNSFATLGLPI